MNPLLKKLLRHISSLLFSLCLIISSSLAVIYFIADQPDTVKGIIKKSGAYETLTGSLLDTLAKQPPESLGSPIPLNNPIIQEAAKQAFSPSVIQKNTESFIDGTYKWLDGSTKNPDFTLDFTSSKQIFAVGVGDYVQNRLASLPPCSYRQVPPEIDVFTLQCLPRGLDLAQTRAQVQSQIANDQNFLGNTKVSGSDVSKNVGTPGAVGQNSKLPSIYQKSKMLFYVFLALLIPFGAGIIWLSETVRLGLKRLSKTLAKSGIAILILGALSRLLMPKLLNAGQLKTNQIADKVVAPLAREFMQATGNVYIVFGLITLLASGLVGGFYWFKYLRGAKPPTQNTDTPQTPVSGDTPESDQPA